MSFVLQDSPPVLSTSLSKHISWPEKHDLFGVQVSATDYDELVDAVARSQGSRARRGFVPCRACDHRINSRWAWWVRVSTCCNVMSAMLSCTRTLLPGLPSQSSQPTATSANSSGVSARSPSS